MAKKDNQNQNIPTPGPDGDVLGAMQAAQASLGDIYSIEIGIQSSLQRIENINSSILGELTDHGSHILSIESLLRTAVGNLSNQSNSKSFRISPDDLRSILRRLDDQTLVLRNLDRNAQRQAQPAEQQAQAANQQTNNAQTVQFTNMASGLQRAQERLYGRISPLADTLQQLNEAAWNIDNAVENNRMTEKEGNDRLDKLAAEMHALTQTETAVRSTLEGDGAPIGKLAGALGSVGGDVVSTIFRGPLMEAMTDVGAAVGTSLGGPAGMAVGAAAGAVIGDVMADKIGNIVKETGEAYQEYMNKVVSAGQNTRNRIVEAGLYKIKQDVKATSTYQIEVYEKSLDKIYSAWDNTMSEVTATMGYTKAQLNTLQDAVAQNLREAGYDSVINAADYLDELGKTLSANLNGTLAEQFAAQTLILEKAVPEFDASSMAKEFAAIYTQAQKEGKNGTDEMTAAMQQIAGAVRAIEQTTDGNNQFISQIPNYLQQAQEMVNRAGGSVDQVAELTTQLMAAEGPISSLTPALSGFAGELVTILTSQNDSSAVALRAIMQDMDSSIGVSMTDFMNSFMKDTQGTLETAFRAIDKFLSENRTDGAQQEFYNAMSDVFGISAEKLAQIDFDYVAEQLEKSNAAVNESALLAAEDLMKSGETTSLEQQLVNNTSNILLATNTLSSTLDNQVMRKLEKNEIDFERLINETTAVQSVNLAEATLEFFTHIKDVFLGVIDPLGLFDLASSLVGSVESGIENIANYNEVAGLSTIQSDVAETKAGTQYIGKITTDTVAKTEAALLAGLGTVGADIIEGFSTVTGSASDLYYEIDSRAALRQMQQQQESMESDEKTRKSFNLSISDANDDSTDQLMDALYSSSQNSALQEGQQHQEDLQAEDQTRQEFDKALKEAKESAAGSAKTSENNQANLRETLSHVDEQVGYINTTDGELLSQVDDILGYASHVDEQVVAINTTSSELLTQLGDFYTSYQDTSEAIKQDVEENTEQQFTAVVNAIKDAKPDVSGIADVNKKLDQLITYFATYLEIINNSMLTSTGKGLSMAASDKQQILQRGLLR